MPSATTTAAAVIPTDVNNLSSYSLRPSSRPAPLLTSIDCVGQVHLVVGGNSLAAARIAKALDSGAIVKLISPPRDEEEGGLPSTLLKRVQDGQVEWIRREFVKEDLTTLGREEVDRVVDRVFVTLPVECAQCSYISSLCRRLRIPVNVVDSHTLSTFSLLSTHTDGPLQIGVTTSGNGCKLANRIRRELVAALPSGIGATCERLGDLRSQLYEADHHGGAGVEDEDESGDQKSSFNALVLPGDPEAAKTRRIRWLSQICEYWPLQQLCALKSTDIDTLLQDYIASSAPKSASEDPQEQQAEYPPIPSSLLSPRGTISLVGSGPGHPDLLTAACLKALQSADLVLVDKLVPAPVASLIPRRASIFTAKKFPGNADNAQEELLTRGLAALKHGQRVVRLKQGDPYIYGRGAEEVEFFERHGYTPSVIPGISSGICAPLFAAIPATHRGVADQVLLCTGTGRKGAAPDPPEYVKSRTTVFLMALHRLKALVAELEGNGWPLDVPCAVVERASCKDQRVVRTTLGAVAEAVEEIGSRPPGLLVVGWACQVLRKGGKCERWTVEEGFKDF